MKTQDFIDFAKIVGRSKKVKRAGWIREAIKDPESVAEHAFRLIVLIDNLAGILKEDKGKLIQMAIVHAIAESSTGDVVVERGKNIDDKKRREKENTELKNVKKITNTTNNYESIYKELTAKKTRAAKVSRELDKLEMAITANEYEKEQGKNLEEFFENAELNVKTRFLRKILSELRNNL